MRVPARNAERLSAEDAMDITNVWNVVDQNKDNPRTRNFIMMAKQSDLMLVINCHEPGYKAEFHHHCGTSQSYLVLKGGITVRARMSADAPPQERRLKAGDCVLFKVGEYYELETEENEPVVLYQAKHPGTDIQLLGREPVSEAKFFGVEV